jgi:hypothetical protein
MESAVQDMPAVEIAKEIELPEKEPVAPSPMSPIEIGFGGTISVKGVVTPPGSTTKASFSKGKVDVEKAIETTFGEVKVTQQVKPGQISRIGIEIENTHLHFSVGFSAHADFHKPFSFNFKKSIDLVEFRLSLARFGVPGEYTFTGTLEIELDITTAMNKLWPGWPNILRLAAQQSRLALQAGGSAARSVFLLEGTDGIVTATTAGAVVQALAIGSAYLAWVAFGLYECGKAMRDGNTMAVRFRFCNGYARVLAEMTSNRTALTEGEVKGLLSKGKNWQADLAKCSQEYISASNGPASIRLLDRAETIGQVAIAVDIDRFIKDPSNSPTAWTDVRRRHQMLYGADTETRRRRYIEILYRQVQTNAARLGIPLK